MKFYINFKNDVFNFNQFLHNSSNLILIRFKGSEENYFYVYQTNFILKINLISIVLYILE
jgi:hypothetical protein